MALWLGRFACFAVGFLLKLVAGGVIELDDSFSEMRGNDPWMVEFYAPWCGHCKKLEPIYHQVWIDLRHTTTRVARMDATRFTSAAAEFGVRGYPTIMFIHGDKVFTYKGDRSKEAIIEFAKRAKGPQVRPITNTGKYTDVMSELADSVWFMYIGKQDAFDDLLTKYTSIAEKYATLSYFFAGERKVIQPMVAIQHSPTVMCFKDGKNYEFDPPDGAVTKQALDEWVNNERYAAFPKMTGGGLNEMSDMQKKIVIVIVDERSKDDQAKHNRLKEIGNFLATKHRKKFHSSYQFVWMGELETVNSIAMRTLPAPSVMVLDPQTQYHYLLEMPSGEITQKVFMQFLYDVADGKSPALGGTGLLMRLKRVFYDIWMTIYSVYDTSGWLALVVFGVPAFVITLVCYVLCCMEPFDDSIFEPKSPEELLELQEEERAAQLEKGEPTTPLLLRRDEDGHIKAE